MIMPTPNAIPTIVTALPMPVPAAVPAAAPALDEKEYVPTPESKPIKANGMSSGILFFLFFGNLCRCI